MIYKELKPRDFETLPPGDKIDALPLTHEYRKDKKVYIFRDSFSSYSCLFQTDVTTQTFPELNGLEVKYETFGEPGKPKTDYIIITCSLNAYYKDYCKIIKEIISDFDSGKFDYGVSVIKIIKKWKHFWANDKKDIMTDDNILGLVGELLFLQKTILLYQGDAVDYWTANRGVEDFIRINNVIEVKSSIKANHAHTINGIDQLLVIPGKMKHILSLLFTRTNADEGLNLPTLIIAIIKLLESDPAAIDLFIKKVKTRGYDIRDEEDYLDIKFVFYKGGFFLVDEYFPKLTTLELKLPLSPRISEIRYTLDMEGLPHLKFEDAIIANIF